MGSLQNPLNSRFMLVPFSLHAQLFCEVERTYTPVISGRRMAEYNTYQ
jgi:hypothetical protein